MRVRSSVFFPSKIAEWSVTIGCVSPRFAILRSSAARLRERLIAAWSEVEQWTPPPSPAAWFSHVAQPHSHDIGSNSQNIGLTTAVASILTVKEITNERCVDAHRILRKAAIVP